MALDLTETLSRLVAIPSVNSMGRAVSGPEYGETRLTDYLESLLDGLGLPYQRQSVHPGRENIIARLDGDCPPEDSGRLILFEAHQDTVPVDGMTIEPWSPTVRDGRLYGRGACDVKGGMTAMLGALARLADQRPPGMPTVVLACTVNEEYGFTGATALADLLATGEGIIPKMPDACIVAEPTDLQVVVAHKGVIRWRCHTEGRAGHSAQPEHGDNAIYKMGRAVGSLERYHREVLPKLGSHPLCGPATLSVGMIHGGVSVNTIPARATIEIDRRLRPGEDAHEARRHLTEYLAEGAQLDFTPTLESPYMQALALSDEANGSLAKTLSGHVGLVAGDCSLVGVPFSTDAPCFASIGIPTVVFGPGSIRQAHTLDEWLPLDQLRQAEEILYRFVAHGID